MRENELALLSRAEMQTVRQMCCVKLSVELRERLGLEDIVAVLQRYRL